MGARDGLSKLAYWIFKIGDVTFVNRADKKATEKGLLDICSKMLRGKDGIIFGEATWNLHPTLLMHRLKAGVTQIALITGKPIVPVIFEYVEVPTCCKKEKELYKKCIVQFGTPIYPTIKDDISGQTESLTKAMREMREQLWREVGIERNDIYKINREVYLNHLYLKKYKAVGFRYDSEWESRFLLDKENEYCLNEEGDFVPGILKE